MGVVYWYSREYRRRKSSWIIKIWHRIYRNINNMNTILFSQFKDIL
jgi:hypothetical protein